MYPRIVTRRRGEKTYRSLHIVESVRIDGKVKQRMLANLGPVESIADKDVDNIINGLSRLFDRRPPANAGDVELSFESARSFGEVFVLLQLWKQLGLTDIFRPHAAGHRFSFDVVRHVQLMVLNRACDPCSKLALLEWLREVHVPGVAAEQVDYHHLLRAMDWLISYKEPIETQLANKVLDLFDEQVDLVFWDVTSTYFETERTDSLRIHGYSRDHRPDLPQLVLGVVMTRDGFPIHHDVFEGSTSDVTTVLSVARKLRKRFPIANIVLVGDRGMISEDNRDELRRAGFGYILAHQLRNRDEAKAVHDKHRSRYKRWSRLTQKAMRAAELADDPQDAEADPLRDHLEVTLSDDELAAWRQRQGRKPRKKKRNSDEQDGGEDVEKYTRRLVLTYDQAVGASSRANRLQRLAEAKRELDDIDAKLLRQDRGEPLRGRELTEDGALLKAAEILRRRRVRSLIDISIDDEDGIFRYADIAETQAWEETIDGVLMLETTLSRKQASAAEVERQYRNLQDLERCFRTLKSSLDLRPIYHWTERRIRAHVFICVIALLLMRVLRARLGPAWITKGKTKTKVGISPEEALRTMGRLQRIGAVVDGRELNGLTTSTTEQREVLRQLELPLPERRHLEEPV